MAHTQRFRRVDKLEEAEIRIGFQLGDGSWSYIGRQVLEAAIDQRTMNFGWDISHEKENDYTTALHEIGHTLGLPHEHQNPFSGIEWDEAAVYKLLSGPPNLWTQTKIFDNVLRKLDSREVRGNGWDADSIMQYPFPPGIIKTPPYDRLGIQPKGCLSQKDIEWARIVYPPINPKFTQNLLVGQSMLLGITYGEQSDFQFVPDISDHYTFGTFGESDSIVALFEWDKAANMPNYITGMDDSATDDNARVTARLQAGHTYMLKIRLMYANKKSEVAVMVGRGSKL